MATCSMNKNRIEEEAETNSRVASGEEYSLKMLYTKVD